MTADIKYISDLEAALQRENANLLATVQAQAEGQSRLQSLLGGALGALQYHVEQTRPIQRTTETIEAILQELAVVREPSKGLFVDLIAEHPGLAEEMAAIDVQPVQEPARSCKVGGSCVAGKSSACACSELLAPNPPVTQPAQSPTPDPFLCKFYQVETFPALVEAQSRHIEKLQAKLPRSTEDLAFKRVREG